MTEVYLTAHALTLVLEIIVFLSFNNTLTLIVNSRVQCSLTGSRLLPIIGNTKFYLFNDTPKLQPKTIRIT